MALNITVRPRIFSNGPQYHLTIHVNELEISVWLTQQERDRLFEMLQHPPLPLGS